MNENNIIEKWTKDMLGYISDINTIEIADHIAKNNLEEWIGSWRDSFLKLVEYFSIMLEQSKNGIRAAWIKDNGYSVCGNCGFINILGHTNFCPECGSVMNMKFGSDITKELYEHISKHRIYLRRERERQRTKEMMNESILREKND